MEWIDIFNEIKYKEYFISLNNFINKEYETKLIFPNKEDIWNAFKFTKFNDIKVVILGQDPYSNILEAHGLAFSTKANKLPPSLKNIFKEIEIEFNILMNYKSGDLTYLALQGVLLLNTILTVENKSPLSHKIKEYDLLMKDIFYYLNKIDRPIVYLLWGNNAKKYIKYLNNKKHLILTSAHPSPLSANKGGWFNTFNFKKCNDFLKLNNLKEINWSNSFNN